MLIPLPQAERLSRSLAIAVETHTAWRTLARGFAQRRASFGLLEIQAISCVCYPRVVTSRTSSAVLSLRGCPCDIWQDGRRPRHPKDLRSFESTAHSQIDGPAARYCHVNGCRSSGRDGGLSSRRVGHASADPKTSARETRLAGDVEDVPQTQAIFPSLSSRVSCPRSSTGMVSQVLRSVEDCCFATYTRAVLRES